MLNNAVYCSITIKLFLLLGLDDVSMDDDDDDDVISAGDVSKSKSEQSLARKPILTTNDSPNMQVHCIFNGTTYKVIHFTTDLCFDPNLKP